MIGKGRVRAMSGASRKDAGRLHGLNASGFAVSRRCLASGVWVSAHSPLVWQPPFANLLAGARKDTATARPLAIVPRNGGGGEGLGAVERVRRAVLATVPRNGGGGEGGGYGGEA